MSTKSVYDKFYTFYYYCFHFHFHPTKCGRYYGNFGFVMKLDTLKLYQIFNQLPNENFEWTKDDKYGLYYLDGINPEDDDKRDMIVYKKNCDDLLAFFNKYNIDIFELYEQSISSNNERAEYIEKNCDEVVKILKEKDININTLINYSRHPESRFDFNA